MGVIFVVAEAMKLGFRNGDPGWSNLGQGQPEVGPLEGAPPRIKELRIRPEDHAYGPVDGLNALRDRVADHYNRLYRRGLRSQYTSRNVSITSGGRAMLNRVFCALAPGRVGYQSPDYTAYEDLFNYHTERVTTVGLTGAPERGFAIEPAVFRESVERQLLDGFVLSNPCNPTGALLAGNDLAAYCHTARLTGCLMVCDEFYSHFVYEADGAPAAGPVSAAAFVEDVERDPVLIIDGLTKSFRYPGWRVGWAVGPSRIIETLGRVGSAIDGGPGQPIQRAAIEVLEPARADQESSAVRIVFARKRRLMVAALEAMGITVPCKPHGTFYVWADLSRLAPPFDDADVFFRAALDRRVLTVPGRFFDLRPAGCVRPPGRFRSWMRFSFGPPEDNVIQGLQRLASMLGAAPAVDEALAAASSQSAGDIRRVGRA